ncbi:MAG: amidoligase family protein [Myxococcales bacterium]|nr:amidoligase family protein [Myxococcales bacterium]
MADPLARVGLELELLAPRGVDRPAVAHAIARKVRGHVEYGFKYTSEGRLPDGRPLCRLSDAVRVVDARGVLVTVVDDPTIRARLSVTPRQRTLSVTDDLRIALLAERICWSRRRDTRLQPLAALFGGPIEGGTLADAFGHPLVVLLEEPLSWGRVCELVTRPLATRAERRQVAELLLGVARELRLAVPAEAGLHAHYDAGPWRTTRTLRRLILESTEHRAAWHERLRPNPRCLKLGPFPDAVVRVAREGARVSFPTFAAAVRLAGARKEGDVNVLGVVEPRPRQPTLELRCLPMSLHCAEVLAALETAEALLSPCLTR